MPIGKPLIHVECDKCGHVSDPYRLNTLGGMGWDASFLPQKLMRDGWKVEGDKTICAECCKIPASRADGD